MGMTVGKLHKILGEQIKQGNRMRPVCIDKATFGGPLEDDGVSIYDLMAADITWVGIADGDGFTATRKDGTERGKSCFVLTGELKE